MATFKILPGDDGAYMGQFAGVTQLDDKVLNIIPIDADQGTPALATASIVAGLRTGAKVNGVVIAVTVPVAGFLNLQHPRARTSPGMIIFAMPRPL